LGGENIKKNIQK